MILPVSRLTGSIRNAVGYFLDNLLQIVAPESSLRFLPIIHFYPISIVQDGSIKANKFKDALDRAR